MENTKKNTKKIIIIAVAAVLAAALIIVPLVMIFAARNTEPMDFLMNEDISKYVELRDIDSINYGDVRESLYSGYDVFRLSVTETYFGTDVYVEEGSTMDFTLSAELVTELDGGAKEYTAITVPDEYAKVVGYRPYSNEENLFFDTAMANAGNLDDYSQYYMSRDTATQFTAQIPEGEVYGEYAGKTVRFTITVTDYVARYIYLYGGMDNSISTVSDWYCEIITKCADKNAGAIEEGDIVLYDCTDKYEDGTVETYTDLFIEVTGDYVKYFEGLSEGATFTESFSTSSGTITEDFTVKGVYKAEDAKKAVKDLGYESIFELKEELRVWCYAVYSDGFMVLVTEDAQVTSYPKSLMSVYRKLEDASWETEFRESAASFASSFGDDTALKTYGITGYETIADYLDDLLEDHVETLVRELMISFQAAKDFEILDSLYERYEASINEYVVSGGYASRAEALATLYDNGDEACVFYLNFLSPILGTKYASLVTGAPFAEFIADSYAY